MTRMRSAFLLGTGLVLAACKLPTGGKGGKGGQGGGVAVASVTVTPPTTCLKVAQTVQLAATTKDAAGNVLTGRTVGWMSSNVGVASVDGNGLVTGVAIGSATITATSEGQSGAAAVALPANSATAKLFGVWALASNFVFAVGEGGTLLLYDGTTWSPLCSGTTNTLYAMGPQRFVVGAGGTILGFDGTSRAWIPQVSGTANALYGLARTPPGGTIVVVGAAGTILHYTNPSWTAQPSGTLNTLYSVDKVPAAPANFAVGAGGTILHYDGTSWTTQQSGTTNDLFFVGVASGTDVYALGALGTALHYDGVKWSALSTGTTVALHSADVAINATTGAITDFFVVGDGGTILHSPDGVTWTAQTSGTTNNLTAVGAVSATDVFAVGAGGTILHYNGTTWSVQTVTRASVNGAPARESTSRAGPPRAASRARPG